MTEVEQTASDIIDVILEKDSLLDGFSVDVKIGVMAESLGELIELLLVEEKYERCALYRDVIKELKRYETGGDKASEINQRLQA